MIFLQRLWPSQAPLLRWGFKLCFSVCVTLIVIGTSEISAHPNSWGVGLMAGKPRGLSLQIPLNRQNALNGSLYYDLRDPSIDLHLDHIVRANRPCLGYFYPYIGWGGYLEIMAPGEGTSHHRREIDLSARIPLGVGMGRSTWRAFIELSPSLLFLPVLHLRIGGSLGIRYHF